MQRAAAGLLIFILLFLVTYLAVPGFFSDITSLVLSGDMTELSHRVKSYGNWAILVSVLLGIAINLSGLPTVAYSGANGIVFGFWTGFGLSWLAEILGAVLALMITRGLVKNRASVFIARHPDLKAVYDFTGRRGFWALLIARVIPFTPSGLINIAAAVSQISFRDYLVATALGKIPSVLAEVYIGQDLFFPWERQARILLWVGLVGALYLFWRSRRQSQSPQ